MKVSWKIMIKEHHIDLDTASAGEIAEMLRTLSREHEMKCLDYDADPYDYDIYEPWGSFVQDFGWVLIDGKPINAISALSVIENYIKDHRDDYVEIFTWPSKRSSKFTRELRSRYSLLAGDKYTVIATDTVSQDRLDEAVDRISVPETYAGEISLYYYDRKYSRSGITIPLQERPQPKVTTYSRGGVHCISKEIDSLLQKKAKADLVVVPYHSGDEELEDAAVFAADSGMQPCFMNVETPEARCQGMLSRADEGMLFCFDTSDEDDESAVGKQFPEKHMEGTMKWIQEKGVCNVSLQSCSVKRPYRKLLGRFVRFVLQEKNLFLWHFGSGISDSCYIHDKEKRQDAFITMDLYRRIVRTSPENWSRDMITEWHPSPVSEASCPLCGRPLKKECYKDVLYWLCDKCKKVFEDTDGKLIEWQETGEHWPKKWQRTPKKVRAYKSYFGGVMEIKDPGQG